MTVGMRSGSPPGKWMTSAAASQRGEVGVGGARGVDDRDGLGLDGPARRPPPRARTHPRRGRREVRADRARPRSGRPRRGSSRASTHRSTATLQQRLEERLVARLELAAAVERDRPAHAIRAPRSVRPAASRSSSVAAAGRRADPGRAGRSRAIAVRRGDERGQIQHQQDRDQEPDQRPAGSTRNIASAHRRRRVERDDPAATCPPAGAVARAAGRPARCRIRGRSAGVGSTRMMVGLAAHRAIATDPERREDRRR